MTITPRLLALAGFILIGLPARASSSPTSMTADSAPSSTGVDLGPSSRVPSLQMAMADPSRGASGAGRAPAVNVQPVHDGKADAHTTGTVNSVDAAQRKLNVSHQPIPALGWPAMTMDFPVARSVDLSRIKPGSRIEFSLDKGKDGMYEVQSAQPAGAAR